MTNYDNGHDNDHKDENEQMHGNNDNNGNCISNRIRKGLLLRITRRNNRDDENAHIVSSSNSNTSRNVIVIVSVIAILIGTGNPYLEPFCTRVRAHARGHMKSTGPLDSSISICVYLHLYRPISTYSCLHVKTC